MVLVGQMKDLIMEKYIGYYEEVVPYALCDDLINWNFNFKPSTYTSQKERTETSSIRTRSSEVSVLPL
jgi:hypothetical protein